MEKIIIIRCGYHGEEIQRVLKIKNCDGRCTDILNHAIHQWNEMSLSDPGWANYRVQIERALTQAGYEFEDVAYDVIDDWEEGS